MGYYNEMQIRDRQKQAADDINKKHEAALDRFRIELEHEQYILRDRENNILNNAFNVIKGKYKKIEDKFEDIFSSTMKNQCKL